MADQNETGREQTDESEEVSGAPSETRPFDAIEKSGSVLLRGGDTALQCVTVIGQIEGHYLLPQGQKATRYEHLIPLLASVEEDPATDGLLLLLNTVGGDVEAGLALAELIAGMKKPTVSLVLGGGHSIGVPLAVSAKKSFIVPSATMTVHPVRTSGLVVSAPQTYQYFRKMQDRIERFVTDHAHIPADRLHQLMMCPDEMATDIGTVLDGEDAVREGLIDAVGSLSDALSALKAMVRRG